MNRNSRPLYSSIMTVNLQGLYTNGKSLFIVMLIVSSRADGWLLAVGIVVSTCPAKLFINEIMCSCYSSSFIALHLFRSGCIFGR